MKFNIIFCFIIIIYTKLPNRTPTQKEVNEMINYYDILKNYTNTSDPKEFENVLYRKMEEKFIEIDTAKEINIENIINENNLPTLMKGFISEIISEKTLSPIYERFYGLKDSLGLIETTQEHATHLQANYDDNNRIIYIMYIQSKIGIKPKIEQLEKTICNKGFFIESCKTVNIYKFVSFLNEEDCKKITAPSKYYNYKMMRNKLKEIYNFDE